MIAVKELSDAKEFIEPLKSIGYEYVPEYEKEIPERRYFQKGPKGVPNKHFHLHMVEHGRDFWKRHLLFRDYLRSHPEMALKYCKLKRELAERYASDREAYTEAKTSFIESVIAQAEAEPRLHLRYVRLPARIQEMYDDLIYRSKRVIVGKSRITSPHSVLFDGQLVMNAGFPIVYFELIGKWFNVIKIRDLKGRHTGYYCDISTPPKLLKDGSVEITYLFLDLWVSPDFRHRVLDEDEMEEALKKGWISKQLYERARKELKKLVALVEKKEFPPRLVRQLEKRLKL
jgi:predicted RNA-binding protein associated with RNAse of E/G family